MLADVPSASYPGPSLLHALLCPELCPRGGQTHPPRANASL